MKFLRQAYEDGEEAFDPESVLLGNSDLESFKAVLRGLGLAESMIDQYLPGSSPGEDKIS